MSRWSDVFAELSEARYNGDNGDIGSIAIPTVTKVTNVTPPRTQKDDIAPASIVTKVTNVNTPLANAHAGEGDAKISSSTIGGLIPGGKIGDVPSHQPRAASAVTMGTMATVALDVVCCCECGLPINECLQTSWGGDPCHRACREAAWRRCWQQ
jgi:hypothetical protein